jgi:hypothetical protein
MNTKISAIFATLAVFFLLLFRYDTSIAQEPDLVRVPRLSAVVDPHEIYIHELLRLILINTKYQITPISTKMQQARAIYEVVQENGRIDLVWTMSTKEREAQMIAIKIPIEKGLIGWRIPFVKEERAALFSEVKTLQQLRAYSAGQEHDWPDVPILRANDLPVVTSSTYEPLFNMLKQSRFDYFPRSMFEIWTEFDAHPDHKLRIDRHIILHYPSAYYFFVSPRRPQLAEAVKAGFETAIKNGSFEKLFQQYNHTSIVKAEIKNRTVIELKNPYFQIPDAMLKRTELWFKP